MDTELSIAASDGLYESAFNIISTKQTKLFPKILQLMTKFYVGTPPTQENKLNESRLKFWLCNVLPLIFEEDEIIKDSAIQSLEAVSPHLEFSKFHSMPLWLAVKSKISDEYSKKVESIRSVKGSNWHKMWCILVQILDKEICKGAMVINIFLTIVENGFRSSDLKIREQSFHCWKLLVEIFSKHNEITIPKRIKLICIPLKSSKSKTETIARNKFDIWWYLIMKLQNNLEVYADTIVEPFLYFCFGPFVKQPLAYYFDESIRDLAAPGKIYSIIREMSIISLINMLGEPNESVRRIAKDTNIDLPSTPFVVKKFFTLKAKLLINSSTECTVMISQMAIADYADINKCLWSNLLNHIEDSGLPESEELFALTMDNITSLIKLSKHKNDEKLKTLIVDIVRMIGTSDAFVSKSLDGTKNLESVFRNTKTYITFLFHSDLVFSEEISREITSYVFDLKKYSNCVDYYDFLTKHMDFVTHLEYSPAFVANYCKTLTHIWSTISICMKEFVEKHEEDFQKNVCDVFLNYLLWPIECHENIELRSIKIHWRKLFAVLVHKMKNFEVLGMFSGLIKSLLIVKHNANITTIVDLFDIILESVPAEFDLNQAPIATLELLEYLIKNLATRNALDLLATTIVIFHKFLRDVKTNCILFILQNLRCIICELVKSQDEILNTMVNQTTQTLTDRLLSSKFINELKTKSSQIKSNCKQMLTILVDVPSNAKRQPDIEKVIAMCEITTSKANEFVVIGSFWKFTPEKLTEHQKEKMKEKRNDIPALYNDMSQSQDSIIIKPWAPKNIIVPSTESEDTIVINASESFSDAKLDDTVPNTEVETKKNDKENNNGNVVSQKNGTEADDDTVKDKNHIKSEKVKKELLRLKTDTVEGLILIPKKLRSRRSVEKLEEENKKKASSVKLVRERRKSDFAVPTDIKKVKKTATETSKTHVKKSSPEFKVPVDVEVPRVSPRKSLNFDNVEVKTVCSPSKIDIMVWVPTSNAKAEQNASQDEVIESSQVDTQKSESLLSKKRARKYDIESSTTVQTMDTLPFDSEAINELNKTIEQTTSAKSPAKIKEDAVKLSEMDTEPNTLLDISLKSDDETITKKNPAIDESISKMDTELNTEQAPIIVTETDQPEELLPKSPNFSPIKSLDEELEPLNKSMNKSIMSSPEGTNIDERNADLLNDTLNISPISEDKSVKSTIDKQAFVKFLKDEQTTFSSPVNRKGKVMVGVMMGSPSSGLNKTPQYSSPSNKVPFKGRGAQLINLIRNQQNESTPKQQPPTPSALMSRKSSPTVGADSPEQQTKPDMFKNTNLLTFSKVLPSPQASPSASILKRKFNHEDVHDDADSPANKRKRVSFHDPPVSVTKQYILHKEECRSPAINRCLIMPQNSTPLETRAKYSLRRKSKVDSQSELAKFTENAEDEQAELGGEEEEEEEAFAEAEDTNEKNVEADTESQLNKELQTTNDMSALRVSITHDTTDAVIDVDAVDEDEDVIMLTPPEPCLDDRIIFKDEDGILKHVLEKYSMDEIVEKYIDAGKTIEKNKSARLLTKELSNLMTKDDKTKHTVLDQLSEKHSVEFLDHAVQENSSSMVCNRLSLTAMIDHIFTKLQVTSTDVAVDERNLKISQLIYDKINVLAKYKNQNTEFNQMNDTFLLGMLRHKSNEQMMDFLQTYFKSS